MADYKCLSFKGMEDEKVYYAKHKSGLEIYLRPTDKNKDYAVIATKYGSLDTCFKTDKDDDFISVPDGIAHFLEHKMFEKKEGDMLEKFSKYGGDGNAFTSFDKTAYHFTGNMNFKENLETLLYMVSHPYFTEKSVQKEMGIIEEEIKMGYDRPVNALYYGLLECLFHSENIHKQIAGSVESIHEITPELLYSCYNTFYNMSNMILSVFSGSSMEDILEICDRVIPEQKQIKIERRYEEEPKTIRQKRFVKELDIPRPKFIIGVKDNYTSVDPDTDLKRGITTELLNDLLFSAISEFTISMYENNIIKNLSAGGSGYKDYNYFYLSGEGDDPELAYEKFVEYIREVKKNGFTEKDFNIVRRMEYTDNIIALEHSGIADMLYDYRFENVDFTEYFDAFKKVTLDDVNELLNELFNEDLYVMSVIKPKTGEVK